MTQTKDLIKKMADFFTSEEYYEKGEEARIELSPDDVRCMSNLIHELGKYKQKMKRIINIPNNATNGDMIKAMFPNAKYQHIVKLSGVNYMMVYGINGLYDNQGNWCGTSVSFNDDWWDSPYESESEVSK